MDHNREFEAGDFPRYLDGDVLISLCESWNYQLHSMTLKLSSSFFRSVLTDNKAAAPEETAQTNGVRLRYRLDFELPVAGTVKNAALNIGMLKWRPLDSEGIPTEPPSPARQQLEDAINRNEGPQFLSTLFRHFDNVFRSYYHRPPQFSNANMIDAVREDVRGIVLVAKALGSIGSIRMPLDVAFYSYGQTLFRSIADEPVAWADIGLRIRSELILREAVCHIVGRWSEADLRVRVSFAFCTQPANQHILKINDAEYIENTALYSLIERKVNEVEMKKYQAEIRMMGFYPDEMLSHDHQPNVGAGSITVRGTGEPTKVMQHTKNIYLWMALNLFRQWMGQQLITETTRKRIDGGKLFYTAISQGGESYLTFDDCERFLNSFPLSAKARTGFDSALGQLKDGLKVYVQPLVKVRSALDVNRFPVSWLTCTEVLHEELPWNHGFRLNSSGSADQTANSLQVPPIPTAAASTAAPAGNSITNTLPPAVLAPCKTESVSNVCHNATAVTTTPPQANDSCEVTVNPALLTRHKEASVFQTVTGADVTSPLTGNGNGNVILPALSAPHEIANASQVPPSAPGTPEFSTPAAKSNADAVLSAQSSPHKKVAKSKTTKKRKTSLSDTDTDADTDVDSTGDYVPPSSQRGRKKQVKTKASRPSKAPRADDGNVARGQDTPGYDSGLEMSQSEISGAPRTPGGSNEYKWGQSDESWDYMDEFGE